MPHVENRITLGNILTLIGTIISAGVILVSIAMWSGRQSQRIEANERAVLDNRTSIAGQESRIRAIETSSARQDERLLLILDTVSEIKTKLEKN